MLEVEVDAFGVYDHRSECRAFQCIHSLKLVGHDRGPVPRLTKHPLKEPAGKRVRRDSQKRLIPLRPAVPNVVVTA